jgi:ABC-type multidrug transport system fused ATPase/permease subunit
MFSNIEETINNLRIVKAFAREDHEMIRFNKVNMANYRSWRKGQIYKALNVPISELNGTVMGIIVLLIGGNQIISGHSNFTLGEFTSFLLAIFSMLHPIKKLSDAYTDVRKAMVSLDRVSVILDRKSEIAEHPDQKSKTDFSSSIELRDVEFSYSPDKPVLKSVSFTINKGEKVALVGSSGSGKTTIANLLTRMYDAQKGSICLDGIPINSIKLKDLRTLFGTVTQESILFSDTIANNIRYGSLREVSDEEIREAARIAYIDDFVETLPHQYNQMLQPKASNLSGGQKQRICIARAIVGNPPILIFDEATSALDTEAERNVQLAIDQATRNRTVVVIAHRLSTILSSDKIVVMDEGEIVGIGPHEELLKNCPRYQVLYNLQFNG